MLEQVTGIQLETLYDSEEIKDYSAEITDSGKGKNW
jgi:hypothetical protein